MKHLRTKLGKRLIDVGLRLYSENPETVKTTEVKQVLGQPLDAAVEVDSSPEQWKPEQHGNVVVAEPDLMLLHRRGKI